MTNEQLVITNDCFIINHSELVIIHYPHSFQVQ